MSAADVNANQMQAAGELEIEMMQDLYKRYFQHQRPLIRLLSLSPDTE